MKPLTLTLIALIFLAQCKKDDDDDTPEHFLTLGDNTEEIVRATIKSTDYYYPNEDTTLTTWDISLMSDALRGFDEAFDFEGSGLGVAIQVPKLAIGSEPTGSFTLSANAEPANTWVYRSEADPDVNSGTLSISKSGSIWTIAVDGSATSGETVKIRYSGGLEDVP